jgi:hypothetical protein
MVRKSAWLLNFDAEEELARPAGYTPSRAVLSRFAALAGAMRGLQCPGDVVLAEGQSVVLDTEFIGMAWCPTPRAQKTLRQAGATVLPAPGLSLLRAVNHRRFSAALGQTLPGARYAVTLDEVRAAIERPSPSGPWLLKRPFGFAGRGRIKVDPARAGDLRHAQAWIEASLRSGEGLQVEPLVERLGDYALHGHVRRSGEVALGEPTRQECDETGAWTGSTRAMSGELAAPEVGALFEQARLAGIALQRAGYFGPFGLDAFRWRGAGGEPRFNPRSEINARYSMGWPVGMGELRPDLEDREIP